MNYEGYTETIDDFQQVTESKISEGELYIEDPVYSATNLTNIDLKLPFTIPEDIEDDINAQFSPYCFLVISE